MFLMLLDLSWAQHLRIFPMKPFYLFLWVLDPLWLFPSVFILRAAFRFHKLAKLFHRIISSSNLSHVGNDLTLDDPFYLPF